MLQIGRALKLLATLFGDRERRFAKKTGNVRILPTQATFRFAIISIGSGLKPRASQRGRNKLL
jgi:hypothetical protein